MPGRPAPLSAKTVSQRSRQRSHRKAGQRGRAAPGGPVRAAAREAAWRWRLCWERPLPPVARGSGYSRRGGAAGSRRATCRPGTHCPPARSHMGWPPSSPLGTGRRHGLPCAGPAPRGGLGSGVRGLGLCRGGHGTGHARRSFFPPSSVPLPVPGSASSSKPQHGAPQAGSSMWRPQAFCCGENPPHATAPRVTPSPPHT